LFTEWGPEVYLNLAAGNSPPQLRGGAPKGEPDRAKPQSKTAGVVLAKDSIDQHHPSLGLALRGLGCPLLK